MASAEVLRDAVGQPLLLHLTEEQAEREAEPQELPLLLAAPLALPALLLEGEEQKEAEALSAPLELGVMLKLRDTVGLAVKQEVPELVRQLLALRVAEPLPVMEMELLGLLV